MATSTDSGLQVGAEIAQEMAFDEVLDFECVRGQGRVCVGEDVAGADAAAASKRAQGVAARAAIVAVAAVGEGGTGTAPSSLLAAESAEHTGMGASPRQDTQAPVPPAGEMRHRKP